MNWFFFFRVLNKDLTNEHSNIISILNNSWDFDGTWPVVIIKTLEISQFEELLLIDISVVSELYIPCGSTGALVYIL